MLVFLLAQAGIEPVGFVLLRWRKAHVQPGAQVLLVLRAEIPGETLPWSGDAVVPDEIGVLETRDKCPREASSRTNNARGVGHGIGLQECRGRRNRVRQRRARRRRVWLQDASRLAGGIG